jgi:hypothetical protein
VLQLDTNGWQLPHGGELLQTVARQIRSELINETWNRERRVFLCGASTDSRTSIRQTIADGLRSELRSLLSIHYPEQLFDELLSGRGSHNLLTLEHLLADGVTAIVIVLESAGALTELGIFSANDRLRKKLIVLQDKRYARDRSFIQLGPIRLLKEENKTSVITMDFEEPHTIVGLLAQRIRAMPNDAAEFRGDNLFHAQELLLPLLYVFEALNRNELCFAFDAVARVGTKTARALVTASLAMLRAERLVVATEHGIALTSTGEERVRPPPSKKRGASDEARTRALDALQLDSLHRTRRSSSTRVKPR